MKKYDVENIVYERVRAPVKFYSFDRGYGFCKREGKQDVFFTAKELEKTGVLRVRENDLLEFDLVPVKDKGGKAINIKILKKVQHGPASKT